MQPRHGGHVGKGRCEADVVDVEQGQRRQRDVDDEAVERRRRILRQAPGTPQPHAEEETGDEKDQIGQSTKS